MILIDDTGHLTATGGPDELHQFAVDMGMNPVWYQDEGRFKHYDCTTPNARNRARKSGAVHVPTSVLFAVAYRAELYEPQMTGHVTILEQKLETYLRKREGRRLRVALDDGRSKP